MRVDAPLLVFAGFAVLVIAVAVLAHIANRRRREALTAVAAALGLRFIGDQFPLRTIDELGFGPPQALVLLAHEPPFGIGDSRTASNLLYGERHGIEWMIFDYAYSTGSGKQRQRHSYGVAIAFVSIPFKPLRLRPQTMFDAIGKLVGMQDIEFELEEFNKRYVVTAEDERYAFDILHPAMIELLMATPEPRPYLFYPYLIVSARGTSHNPGDIYQIVREVEEMMKLIPEYVKESL